MHVYIHVYADEDIGTAGLNSHAVACRVAIDSMLVGGIRIFLKLACFAGSVCCRSAGNATDWGHSAMKLTNKMFSALKNIGGSFVQVEDGILSTASRNGTLANCDSSELAEEAALRVDSERSSHETDDSIDSIPVIRLDAADVVPVQVTVCTNSRLSHKDCEQDNIVQQSSSSLCSQDSADFDLKSFSTLSEFDDQTTDELNDDDNIVFSYGTRRKIRRNKQLKGNKSLSLNTSLSLVSK